MDDLPTQPKTATPTAPAAPVDGNVSSAKEAEGGIGMASGELPTLHEVGRDIDLPKEVAAVGVHIQPTVVAIPPKVSQMGVAPAGANVTVASGASVSLPLNDDQIATGMKQGVTSSFRWLAEWCVRKLKQMHIILKNIGGKTVEVKE
jgi:hypothetical protein